MARKLHPTKTMIKKTPSRIKRSVVRVSGILLLLLALAAGIFLPGSKPESMGGRGRSRMGTIHFVSSPVIEPTEPVATAAPEIFETVATVVPEETVLPDESPVKWYPSPYNFTVLGEICYSKPSDWKWWIAEVPQDCFGSKKVTPITLGTKNLPVGMKVLAVGSKLPSNDFRTVANGNTIAAPAEGKVVVCKTQETLKEIEGKTNMHFSIFKIEEAHTFSGSIVGGCYIVDDYYEVELTRALIWEALNGNGKGWDLKTTYFTITFQTALTGNWFGEQAFTNLPELP